MKNLKDLAKQKAVCACCLEMVDDAVPVIFGLLQKGVNDAAVFKMSAKHLQYGVGALFMRGGGVLRAYENAKKEAGDAPR